MSSRLSLSLRREVRFALAGLLLAAGVLTERAAAVVVYSNSFNTDTGNALVTYPEFTLYTPGGSGDTASVSAGVLNLTSNAGGNSFAINQPMPSAWEMEFDLGGTTASTSIGSDAVGARIGNYTFIFFPGFPNGALQIRTVNGNGQPSGLVVPDQSIGFTPATGVLHHMKIAVSNQTFDFEFTNGSSPFQTGFVSFTAGGSNPLYVPGPIGFAQINNLTGIFDNLILDDLAPPPVPEPSALILLAGGVVVLVGRRRCGTRA